MATDALDKAFHAGDAVIVTDNEALSLALGAEGRASLFLPEGDGAPLLNALRDRADGRPVIVLAFGNAPEQRAAQASLKAEIHALGAACGLAADICPGWKTCGDAADFLSRGKTGPRKLGDGAAAFARRLYRPNADDLDYFRHIEEQEPAFEAKTGFSVLDDEGSNLYGGLHEGLHVAGAVMSEGKSTLSLQIGDQSAALGTRVMYFATEQTRRELMAKSISRETFNIAGREQVLVDGRERPLAKDCNQVGTGRRYASYTEKEKEIIRCAIDRYAGYADKITIIDRDEADRRMAGASGPRRLTAAFITKAVRDYVYATGNRPLVIVDYLQDLAAPDPRMNDKQAVDATVYELKSLASEFGIPVWAVSSFNRESYFEPVSISAFKESGSIEYAADFLYGLQLSGMEYTKEDRENTAYRRKRVYELRKSADAERKAGGEVLLDFICLKQRNGMRFTEIFGFTPMYSIFREGPEPGFVPLTARQADELPFGAPGGEYVQEKLEI